MIVTTFAGGSQTATIATEHFVATPTAPGHYQFKVDLASMAAADVTELRIYGMVAAGGNSRSSQLVTYFGVQPTDAKIAYAPVFVNDHSGSNAVRFSLKQTFGTGRVYDWAVMAWGHQAGLDQLTNQVWATPVRTLSSGGSATVDTTAVIAIASGVWDQQRNARNASGSFGNLVQTFGVTVATILQTPKDEIVNQVWATSVRTVTSVSSPVAVASNYDKGNYTLSTTAVTVVADGWLDRDMSTGVDSGSPTVRTPRQALRASRNKVDLAGVVYKEDDSTVSWTFTVASDSNTTRIISVDPA